ncbi:MAG: flagellar basal body P-ring formation chaperone FlgA [Burkholderiaceae bacterium]|nr:flagellar basal body P-ring formation chaperone FlgA [Burkholderiaceae bacterium]
MKVPIRHARATSARFAQALASACGLALMAGILILCTPLRVQAQAAAGESIDALLVDQVRELALLATQQTAGAQTAGATNASTGIGKPIRFDVVVGALDPRLKLAPCRRIEPYLPPGVRLWGKARIGLRCTEGVRAWNVYLPITVRVYGNALVAALPLPAGATVRETDLRLAEIDLAEENGAVVTSSALAVGRTLARPLTAGQGVRQTDLKLRQWFAAGDTIKVLATGPGFSVAGSGQALTPGLEGQSARVRTEGGQVITGMPIGTRELEVSL